MRWWIMPAMWLKGLEGPVGRKGRIRVKAYCRAVVDNACHVVKGTGGTGGTGGTEGTDSGEGFLQGGGG